jgi:hypothetical protein
MPSETHETEFDELFQNAYGCRLTYTAGDLLDQEERHEINNVTDAKAFLGVRSPDSAYALGVDDLRDQNDKSNICYRLNLLCIHIRKNIFFKLRRGFRATMGLEEWTTTVTNNASAPGRLLGHHHRLNGHKDQTMKLLLETPCIEGPYLYLTMETEPDLVDFERNMFVWDLGKPWRVVVIYDMVDFFPGKVWAAYHKRLRVAWNLRDQYDDIFTPASQHDDTFMTACRLLMGSMVEQYMVRAQNAAKNIGLRIEAVSENLQRKNPGNLSASITTLNECSHDIRRSNLNQQTQFASEAVKWASRLLRDANLDNEAEDLLLQLRLGHTNEPAQLRERIVEARSHIADIAAQQQQALEERQRRREERLQDLSIAIAMATRRDSRTMRGIAWVTIAFLPATFITSFFGMNFFNGRPGTPAFDQASGNM